MTRRGRATARRHRSEDPPPVSATHCTAGSRHPIQHQTPPSCSSSTREEDLAASRRSGRRSSPPRPDPPRVGPGGGARRLAPVREEEHAVLLQAATAVAPSPACRIVKMEKLVSDRKEQVLDDSFGQKLVEEFSHSAARVGSRALQATQVRPASTTQPACLPTASEENPLASEADALVSQIKASASEEKVLALDTSISNNEDALSPDLPKETIDKVPEFKDLQFEARSSKDSAWYDVALFLAHRKTSSGEVEVRVRYIGFGGEEDEWVNVRKAVRQQSIPPESSECQTIVKGDLVLCFKESNDEALHFDAHVLDVQRKQHDIRGCRCVFHVEYDHDQSQEMVNLKRLSRRPKYL